MHLGAKEAEELGENVHIITSGRTGNALSVFQLAAGHSGSFDRG